MANYISKSRSGRGAGPYLGQIGGYSAGAAGGGAQSGGVGTMANAQSNVFAPPGTFPMFGIDFTSAHTWAWIWFGAAVAWLFGMYFVHGGRSGGAL